MAFEMQPNGFFRMDEKDYFPVGFGTYLLQGEIGYRAFKEAIKCGYQILDTATFYDNFEPLGKALNEHERDNFYLISKVWQNDQTSEGVHRDIKKTLERLRMDYLDAYLLHWPNHQIPIEETLLTMNAIRKQGLIRHIGMCNVNVNHLKRALEVNVPISWVQVEMHPFFYDAALLDFCQNNSITMQAWRPLDYGRLGDDSLLADIGKKYEKTVFQVALKWILQHECIPFPRSKSEAHIKENIDVMDFTLTSEEIERIDLRAKAGSRVRLDMKYGLGFEDEFDSSYEECWPK